MSGEDLSNSIVVLDTVPLGGRVVAEGTHVGRITHGVQDYTVNEVGGTEQIRVLEKSLEKSSGKGRLDEHDRKNIKTLREVNPEVPTPFEENSQTQNYPEHLGGEPLLQMLLGTSGGTVGTL